MAWASLWTVCSYLFNFVGERKRNARDAMMYLVRFCLSPSHWISSPIMVMIKSVRSKNWFTTYLPSWNRPVPRCNECCSQIFWIFMDDYDKIRKAQELIYYVFTFVKWKKCKELMCAPLLLYMLYLWESRAQGKSGVCCRLSYIFNQKQ